MIRRWSNRRFRPRSDSDASIPVDRLNLCIIAVVHNVTLLGVLALLSAGNGLLNVGITAMVSAAADESAQGSAFGVTQGAGSLGRTLGPPAMTAIYVLYYWAPFIAGAVLTVGVLGALVAVARRSDAFETIPPGSDSDSGPERL